MTFVNEPENARASDQKMRAALGSEEDPPDEEDEAESDDGADDDRVPSLSHVDPAARRSVHTGIVSSTWSISSEERKHLIKELHEEKLI